MAVKVKAKYQTRDKAEAMWLGLREAARHKLRTANFSYVHIAEMLGSPESPLKDIGLTVS